MNKTFKLYGLIFIIVMAILALLELSKTEVTDWRKNFDINEKSPFGLFVFNKEVNQLLNDKVKRTDLSPYDFYKTQKLKPHNILIIESKLDSESWNKILKNVEAGSDALVISEYFNQVIADSLGFSTTRISYEEYNRLLLTDLKFANDSLQLDKLPSGKGFDYVLESTEILGKEVTDSKMANFIKINHGKGHLYLHSESLIVTNYYLLKPENEKYVQDVFSYLPDRETVWFSGANKNVAESRSPLRFILANPGLRYAWWLLLGGLLLFIIFNAKRKQRIVPIIEPKKNKSVEFVKSIGNLYLQEGDFHDMMAKKAQYFLNRVRIDLMIDTKDLDEKFINLLHLKTGKSVEKITEATNLIKRGQDPYARVMQEDLIKMNKLLDEILL
ncbi:DUF4350 domain-containing protein [Kaistella antarctica]|uniref:DUF4350 domain-containing protein n=1 Tax=Kaistella antarctica TaxID=266748 RepID=A0A448NRW4_9FLAO|nr:DUF4350 domain-containing protein [Kaistella antarctica]KEY18652.1 hypothetical protein HY04_09160 [Kaistella antarctica]SEW17046.1 hypothetical protein SAMN05421765_2900 [Kaistella antarctica]VEH99762.1 Uncharacterised protein [Kaistella antarctica]